MQRADITGESAEVQAIAGVVHTAQLKAAFGLHKAAQAQGV
tara:strand:- start:27 stop:149 length:123 start_codon:yes stop_codon:yes gene_type:complete